MAILEKIKGSTLMETLVATVLIVVIFMISSMILNNLFLNTQNNETGSIETYLTELQYLYHNEKIELPYHEDFKEWNISVFADKIDHLKYIHFEATYQGKTVRKTMYEGQ